MNIRDNNIEQNKKYLIYNNKLYKEYNFKYAPNDNEETLYSFFKNNGLLNENNLNYIFKIKYNKDKYIYIYLKILIMNIEYMIYYHIKNFIITNQKMIYQNQKLALLY